MQVKNITSENLEKLVENQCLNFYMNKFEVKSDKTGSRYCVLSSTKNCNENTVFEVAFAENVELDDFLNDVQSFASNLAKCLKFVSNGVM